MSLKRQELLTIPDNLISPAVLGGVRIVFIACFSFICILVMWRLFVISRLPCRSIFPFLSGHLLFFFRFIVFGNRCSCISLIAICALNTLRNNKTINAIFQTKIVLSGALSASTTTYLSCTIYSILATTGFFN